MLDAVVISDLHLGAANCQVDTIEAFLDGLPETRRLILNGDVLESSEHRLRKSHWRVLSRLRKLSADLELVWVEGNHDLDAESVAHLVGADFVPSYDFVSGSESVLCIHGHQWDDFITERPLLTWIADLAYMNLQRLDLGLARMLKRNSKTFLRCCDKVRDGAVTLAKKHNHDKVVCGHTHHAEFGTFYCNSGCWTEDKCHYLTVGNGRVLLEEVLGDK